MTITAPLALLVFLILYHWTPDVLKRAGSRTFVRLNRAAPKFSWLLYLLFTTSDTFERDLCQAWHDHLEGMGKVSNIYIFVGGDSMCVPILFDPNITNVGNYKQTFEHLHMW